MTRYSRVTRRIDTPEGPYWDHVWVRHCARIDSMTPIELGDWCRDNRVSRHVARSLDAKFGALTGLRGVTLDG